jgi:hypothetical protein
MTKTNNTGQAMIMLLFFIMMGITITSTAIFVIAGNSMAASSTEQGEITRQMAETGIERAILQILRNGTIYTGETLTNADISDWDASSSVEITVATGTNIIIDSVAVAGNYVRKLEVVAHYDNNELMIDTWKEKD